MSQPACNNEPQSDSLGSAGVWGIGSAIVVIGIVILVVHNSHIGLRHELRSRYYQGVAQQNAENLKLSESYRKTDLQSQETECRGLLADAEVECKADVAFVRSQGAECRSFLTELEGDYMELLLKYLALRFGQEVCE